MQCNMVKVPSANGFLTANLHSAKKIYQIFLVQIVIFKSASDQVDITARVVADKENMVLMETEIINGHGDFRVRIDIMQPGCTYL